MDVASQVIKVYVAPTTRTAINQADLGVSSNKVPHVPAPTDHGLCALASGLSHNLASDHELHTYLVNVAASANQKRDTAAGDSERP